MKKDKNNSLKYVLIALCVIFAVVVILYICIGRGYVSGSSNRTGKVYINDEVVVKLYDYVKGTGSFAYPEDGSYDLSNFPYKKNLVMAAIPLTTDTDCKEDSYQLMGVVNPEDYHLQCQYITESEFNTLYKQLFNEENTSYDLVDNNCIVYAYEPLTERYYVYNRVDFCPYEKSTKLVKAYKTKDTFEIYEDAIEFISEVGGRTLACRPNSTEDCIPKVDDYSSLYTQYKYTFTKNEDGSYAFSSLEAV